MLFRSPFNPLELVARVKSQIRRYTKLGNAAENNQAVYQTGGLVINDDLKEVTVDDEPVKLTPIEYNILLLLMKNQGKVFSISQIYESIWNADAIGAAPTGQEPSQAPQEMQVSLITRAM